jgi:sulfate/thiosulfate transport system permease protein
MSVKSRKRGLPGFGLTLGLTISYLCLVVLIPLSMAFLQAKSMTWEAFTAVVTRPSAIAAFKLTIWTALAASLVNVFFGVIIAWTLARYRFPGRRIIDGLIDLPFALPTAVAGIVLTTVYSANGWIGQYIEPRGIKVAFEPLGIVVALVFIGIPFVVRTVQPVLEDLDAEIEEAAASLGASRFTTFTRVIAPLVLPAVLTGFALAFSRALGEYGSVVFISGNIPMKTEIAPLIIMSKLEQFNVPGATAIAVVMLVFSFFMLLLINGLQSWSSRRTGVRGA